MAVQAARARRAVGRAAVSRALLRTVTLVLAVASVIVLVRIVLRVPALVPLDPNEGWNAYHAAAALAGSLYPAPESLYFNNYPPLSFHVVGRLSLVMHDAIAAGRALSVASFIWILAATGHAARSLGANRAHAAFACALLAAVFLLYSHYVGIDDPQLFGHAIAATGMAVILRQPQSRVAAAVGAALCACALFVKPNLVALPIALLIWLAMWHRQVLAAYVASGLVAAFALLGACSAAYGTGFMAHLVSPRVYSMAEAWSGGLKWLTKTAAFFVPLAWVGARFYRNRAVSWCLVYVAVSTAFGLYFIGGAGVDQNVFFDAYIALALSAGIALQRTSERGLAVLACFVIPLAVSLGVQWKPAWLTPGYWTAPEAAASQAFAESVAFVRERTGAAACEEQSLCYRAGKPRGIDFVNLGQHLAKGKLDERVLIAKIEGRAFAVVQVGAEPPGGSALGRALRGGYVVGRRDGWGVYYITSDHSGIRRDDALDHSGVRPQ